MLVSPVFFVTRDWARAEQAVDDYLLRYESGMRKAENDIRRQARNALAREGIIATEGEIRKWREKNKDVEERIMPAAPPASST